ncbi:hypothetical protein AArcSl_1443 [Halalkaliarchaeum desulfuricum]|uniref:Uncharacterized protein n=1 Tax=Halalkaliarchaeum desulfuricum TaxID=2055893 RepID=A0A343TJ01_9EURY|nr:hypothetical protein [Halalkaliarchaeum desulfuricum]AUX09073.1 hypothetical protein AArcSl_1443 [Halalkaliarchaeum desulfuricum]
MSFLDTIRSWFRSLFGGEPEDEDELDTDEDAAEPAEPADPEPRLDPDGVTEVRKESDDDPIDRLREVKQKQQETDGDGDGDGSEGGGPDVPR